ncbi:alanine-zipper protein [Steroidobacter flavus]|uniref:Alanine-zipper protein n=1 Tax=Steroidobacter flavus TaxID=1842136 RepID=A0ABV8SM40_9GAMM
MKKKSAPARAGKGKKKNVGELQRQALDARKRAESAKQEARDAKTRAREARKLFKEAKKVAKKARAELEGLSKKLKKLLGPDATLKGKPKKRSA